MQRSRDVCTVAGVSKVWMQVNVRPNAVSTLTNCALCPLLAVSCGDAGLGFLYAVSSPRMDYKWLRGVITWRLPYQPTHPSVCLSVCPSVRPSVHPSIHPSIHPSTYLPILDRAATVIYWQCFFNNYFNIIFLFMITFPVWSSFLLYRKYRLIIMLYFLS
jgi:hypothetical protein